MPPSHPTPTPRPTPDRSPTEGSRRAATGPSGCDTPARSRTVRAALATGLVAGGVTFGALLGAPLTTSAQDAQAADEPAASEAPADRSQSTSPPNHEGSVDREALAQHRTEWITKRLEPLVDDGTLTAAQMGSVVEVLTAPLDPSDRFPALGVLGMSAEEVRDALQDGTTMRELAEAQGVPVEELTSTMAEALDERLERAVERGTLTQNEADRIRAAAPERIEAFIDGQREPGRLFGERGGPFRERSGPFGERGSRD